MKKARLGAALLALLLALNISPQARAETGSRAASEISAEESRQTASGISEEGDGQEEPEINGDEDGQEEPGASGEESLTLPETGGTETAAEAEELEGYCAYAIDSKLYAFIELGENHDPDSFYCNFKSDNIRNRKFQYLKSVTQTSGNAHYIFIIDNSGTMKRYKDEINAYIQALSESEEMNAYYTLATFGERFDIVKERMTDINTVLYELDQISFQEEYTDPYTAMKSADIYLDSYLRGGDDLVSVILVTDGQPALKDKGKEPALAEEAAEVIHSATDLIYHTLCTGNWTETGEESLVAGKGLHELIADADAAAEAGRRMAEFLDSLYCVCFDLEEAPIADFSFEMSMGFGTDYDGNLLNISNLLFDGVHNIKIQNLDARQPEGTELSPEASQKPVPSIGESMPAEEMPSFGDPVEIPSDIPSPENENSDDEILPNEPLPPEEDPSDGIWAFFSKPGALLAVICVICAVTAVFAVVMAITALYRKNGRENSGKASKGGTREPDAGVSSVSGATLSRTAEISGSPAPGAMPSRTAEIGSSPAPGATLPKTAPEYNSSVPEPVRPKNIGIPMRLEIYSGRCRNQSAFLTLTSSLDIGSADYCDIVFDNPEVAAKNSSISFADGQIYIEDLNSPQGTALDGMRIQGKNRLQSGEVISIGSVEFAVFF